MLLSACLLSYNSSSTLEKAIKSILKQDFNDYELIISDDCSSDDSFELIKSYASKSSNITAVKTPHNMGVAGNANFAVSHAKGKYIAILHHDDEYTTDMFTKWVQLMETNSDVGLCFNDYSCKEKNISSIHKRDGKVFDRILPGKKFLKDELLKNWGCPVWGSYITRRKTWEELNGFKPEFGILPDVDYTMRIASDYNIGYINKPLMDIKRGKPDDYPDEYKDLSWPRLFTLYKIHHVHINRKNYSGIAEFLLKRFALKNRVSFQIIKWHLYSVYKKRKDIADAYPYKNENELFYSVLIRKLVKFYHKYVR